MNIPDSLLADGWYWLAWAVWVVVMIFGARQTPWNDLKSPLRGNVWLGMIVFMILVWSLKAGVRPGLDFHFLGAMLFTLCFGPWLGFFGLMLVLAGVTLNGAAGWFAFALNSLLMGGVGVLFSHAVFRLSQRLLPPQLFVYVFVNGFFGAGLAILAVGICATFLLAVAGAYSVDYLLAEYLPYYLLLGFSEAWLTGMMITLFVIYRPAWIATFDDVRYLTKK